jgi:class 3 adenylate cyclase
MTTAELPSGTVTFLFTDIEGSTRLAQTLGYQWVDVLAEHRRTLREIFTRHEGVEVDTQGDSFFVAFERASDGVGAASEAQDELHGGAHEHPDRLAYRRGGAQRAGLRRS